MIIEELFANGVMTMGPSPQDPTRQVGVFAPGALADMPVIRARAFEDFAWIAGRWSYENRVPATPSSPAYVDAGEVEYFVLEVEGWISSRQPERRLLIYDPMSRQWMYILTRGAYCLLRSPAGWNDRLTQIVFEGRMAMLGLERDWRMTWTRLGSTAFCFVNEERHPGEDGVSGNWVFVDEWQFRRLS